MLKGIAGVAGAFIAGPALACTVLEPFEMARIAGAELVVVGEVTGYRKLEGPTGAALVTVWVEETLKGEAGGEMVLVWNAGMAQGPHEARAKGRVLIGARRGGRLALSELVQDARPDLPSIIQPYCGEVWMQPATLQAVAAARGALE